MQDNKPTMHYGAKASTFQNAQNLRNRQTKAEEILWEQLRKKQLLGFKFRRQHPLNNFVADFYCHQAKLVIEVDGGYHNEKEQQTYDAERDRIMRELGIEVMRFKNEEVNNGLDVVLERIRGYLEGFK